jgi:L-alanine-DL-glutamate epimerase-like enolase superfamily enzyme
MDVAVDEISYRLRAPLRTAYGDVAERRTLVLTITTADGTVGQGEAAPLEPYDGVPLELVEQALERYVAILRADGDRLTGPQLLDACREAADLPQAVAAVDLALWDAAARRAGRPLGLLLRDDGTTAATVAVNATLGATDPGDAATEAQRAAAAGFTCVKVKVGVGDDESRVAAVRAAVGKRTAIRVDANGAWSPEEAVARIAALDEAAGGLELVEEPTSGLVGLRTVRERVDVPIAMDETAARHGAIASGATDAVCLKLSRAGGIGALLAQAALVRATGAEPYLASTLDGPLGIAAAVHCAAALRIERACGLATLALFEEADGPVAHDGRIRVPTGPGLGVDQRARR